MSIKIRKLLLFFFSLLFFVFFAYNFSNANEVFDLTAKNAIAIEADTGEILFEHNSKEKMYPASTTKIWTAYLVIKNVEDLNAVVEVKNDLSWVEPSSMFLKVGEKFTVRQLLEVLMLKSANDVAVLLAEYVSGSIEEFAKLMNEEAKKIGCTGTNFVNPNGLPDENHYSTAQDIALMAKVATKSSVLREIANTKSVTIPANDIYPYDRNYTNSNKFLTGNGKMVYNGEEIDIKYDIVNGLKTGYTSAAGRCLVSTASLEGSNIIVAVFGAQGDNVYLDSRKIIDYSFEKIKNNPITLDEMISEDSDSNNGATTREFLKEKNLVDTIGLTADNFYKNQNEDKENPKDDKNKFAKQKNENDNKDNKKEEIDKSKRKNEKDKDASNNTNKEEHSDSLLKRIFKFIGLFLITFIAAIVFLVSLIALFKNKQDEANKQRESAFFRRRR